MQLQDGMQKTPSLMLETALEWSSVFEEYDGSVSTNCTLEDDITEELHI